MESATFDNDKFITVIHHFSSLWDKSHSDYSNKVKKANAWKSVMSEIFGEEEIEKWEKEKQNEIGKGLQKKWKNLRNSFARELAKRKNCKSGSGRTWKTYIYFDQLSFLMPSMSHAESENNFSQTEGDEIEVEATETPLFFSPTQSRSMSRKRKTIDSESDLAAVWAKSFKWKQENEERMGHDPDRLFLLSLLQDFKMIPQSRKASVRIAIINAISNGLYFPPPLPHPPPPTLPLHYSSHIPYNDRHSVYPTVSPHPLHTKSIPPHNISKTHSRTAQSTPSPQSDIDSQSSSDSSPFLTLY